MPDIRLDSPPVLRGTTEEQLQQLYRYLFRLTETLNIILRDLEMQGADDGKGRK